MSDLFHHAALMRASHHREPGFNLFSVLRTNSDEVYLHSRFLAFLLDPSGAHACGSGLLQAFLEVMKIENFEVETATVQAEYKSIDIFIRNAKGQAIVIENKIYAQDAYEQLYRYDQLVKKEGYQQITNCYLTLDGSEPAEHSKRDVQVTLISYETDIVRWLELCVPLVARNAGLREGVFQYIELLKRLTSTDQGGKYMDELKKKLREGDNLLLVADIDQAYKEVLVDLQEELWEHMRAYRLATYPEMPAAEDTADRDTIRNYYTKSKNNRYYGLYYPLAGIPGYAYIQVDHRLYFGYCTKEDEQPSELKALLKLSQTVPESMGKAEELFWRYPTQNLDLRFPTRQDLKALRDPAVQMAIAKELVDGVHMLWSKALGAAQAL
ncbi:PD-(D/E)XK nuclease family protein [Pseudomonas rossensis]|uniref:PDDEXK-like family protein n=1 Tax=Pseudomonas rossensis TaxID=2305471 RepID=UPI0032604535